MGGGLKAVAFPSPPRPLKPCDHTATLAVALPRPYCPHAPRASPQSPSSCVQCSSVWRPLLKPRRIQKQKAGHERESLDFSTTRYFGSGARLSQLSGYLYRSKPWSCFWSPFVAGPGTGARQEYTTPRGSADNSKNPAMSELPAAHPAASTQHEEVLRGRKGFHHKGRRAAVPHRSWFRP